MSDDKARGRSAARQVRSVSHPRGGGHSPYRFRREPNTYDPLHPHRRHGGRNMEFQEYPKWLHFEGEPSVLVQDADEEAAALAERAPAPTQETAAAKPRKTPVTQAE